MGYGNRIYRRSSGIYVSRLCIPSALRGWFARRELHQSTAQRDRARALAVAAKLRLGWDRLFVELALMEQLLSRPDAVLVAGDGVIALGTAATVLRLSVVDLALELANQGASFYVYADGWQATACNLPRCALHHEDDQVVYAEVEAIGDACSLNGPVRLLDHAEQILRLQQSAAETVQPYYVSHATHGPCFLRPGPLPSIALARVLVEKVALAAWRVATSPVTVSTGSSPVADQDIVPVRAIEPPAQVRTVEIASTTQQPTLAVESQSPSPSALIASAAVESRFASMRMTEVIEKFIADRREAMPGQQSTWKPEEAERNRKKLMLFSDLTGNPTMGDLDRVPESDELVKDFLRQACRLPSGPALAKARREVNGLGSLALIEWAERKGLSDRMALQTARNSYLLKVSECLAWAQSKTYLRSNPCSTVYAGIKLAPSNSQKKRKNFDNEDLALIFGAKWFKAGGPPRNNQGALAAHFRPFYYWLPLLGLYTGARVNELSQLYLADFRSTVCGQSYISFTLDKPDKIADSDEDEDDDGFDGDDIAPTAGDKKLKTAASARDVPLHPELIRLGLLDYVDTLRRAGRTRLFEELRFDPEKGYGADARKWFNDRYMGGKLGIPRDGTKVFHSFRHTFVTTARRAGIGQRDRQQLIGHRRREANKDQTIDLYDHDDDIADLATQIDRVKFDLPLIGVFDALAGLSALQRASAIKVANARSRSRDR